AAGIDIHLAEHQATPASQTGTAELRRRLEGIVAEGGSQGKEPSGELMSRPLVRIDTRRCAAAARSLATPGRNRWGALCLSRKAKARHQSHRRRPITDTASGRHLYRRTRVKCGGKQQATTTLSVARPRAWWSVILMREILDVAVRQRRSGRERSIRD